ncbi:TPR-like protein [Rhizoclosmatium globosum]|uniref:Tetratricopeptide repeat protein 29 n=1 Tax=Rhizoclosmatium globosum TaxID=329046 RepID=A0A1Y2CRQ2_9FUNG|nr:Tetratricopeptide repeat protein 29 [Rhizoclosmatium hyalinum]KAJ3286754.1 Tetratricopeptide repeat protein 29 [Rhizoclosmatium sp. JEL0117]ORY49524.1 TPR-like protein [Rhizoclosmatium globosum]|eukprot:ORY49524.1 TPR-like protein [Rhizoclosmatium globosum]
MASTALPALPTSRTGKETGNPLKPKQPPSSADPASKTRIPITQSICLQLLTEGQIHSFIDFFNIVHTPYKPNQPPTPVSTYSLDELTTLKNLLTTSEIAIRNGERSEIYEAKKALGFFYKKLNMLDLSLAYLREAYECARTIHVNKQYEIEAAHNLGLVLASMGEAHEALKLYEQSRSLANEKGDVQAETLASKSLVAARILIAKDLEKNAQFKDAIVHYAQSIQIIEKSTPDEKMVNDLNYCLGNAHKEDGQIDVAVQFLDKYLTKCKDLNDPLSAGKAQLALASCYESSGNLQQATNYLKLFIESTEQDPAQKQSLAQACNQIGVLYNKLGQFPEAVQYFDRHFALACEIAKEQQQQNDGRPSIVQSSQQSSQTSPPTNSTPSKSMNVGAAQIQLGLSKANANMETFFNAVVQSGINGGIKNPHFSALLSWKAARAFEVFADAENQ